MIEVPLAYLPGNVTRVKVTAVGDLLPPQQGGAGAVVWNRNTSPQTEIVEEGMKSYG